MKNKYHSIAYDFLSILFVNLAYLPFIETAQLLKISLVNTFIILIYFIINFYKKSSILRIIKKIIIILLINTVVSALKIIIFGKEIYFSFLVYQDLLLLILFLLPRLFLNIKEINITFIKNYNSSRQGTLVIGGLGYIGSGVVLDLLNKNNKVSVLDCAMYGDNVLNKFYKFPNFNFVKGYASDLVLLGKLLKENARVVHLAGLVGDPACALNERDTKYFNIKTTNIIKNLCYEYDIQRLIFSSSCSVYGKTSELCYEDSPTSPVSLYAQTKLDSEKELMDSKIDTKVLRFSTIFGQRKD
jgi:FlaA1/EpsC-like NDP-sugar epimerase